MRKLLPYLILYATLLVAAGCKKDKQEPEVNADLQIRVVNSTMWTFFNCAIGPPSSNPRNYGNVAIDDTTSYRPFALDYEYFHVSLTMNNIPYQTMPVNYASDHPLEKGKYTFKIFWFPATDRIGIEIIKD
jgi:hypothetical protein